MTFITAQQKIKLMKNGTAGMREQDHFPIVKLILPGTNCIWLLTEIDPDSPDTAFGLCDLGMGFPEMGYVSLLELEDLLYKGKWKVEQDLDFVARHPISVYARAARMTQAITEIEELLIRNF